jgi:hypothetical protein
MRRLPGALAVLGLIVWIGGCASTTTPARLDGDAGDMVDTGDLSDLPPDTTDMPSEVPTEVPPDLSDVTETTGDDGGGGGGVVGDPCYSATQCGGVPGAGVTCLTSIMGYITFPGGYCSAVCTSDADCGPEGACVNLSDLGRYCLKRCTSGADCRTSEGYDCVVVTGAPGTYCLPPMSSPESDS